MALGGGGCEDAVRAVREEAALCDAYRGAAVDDVVDLIGRAGEGDGIGCGCRDDGAGVDGRGDRGAAGDVRCGEGEGRLHTAAEGGAQGGDEVCIGDGGVGGCGSVDGAAGDGGADVGGVVRLYGEDSGGCSEQTSGDAGGGDEGSGSGVCGDAYVFKDEGSEQEGIEADEGREGRGTGGCDPRDFGRDCERGEEGEIDGGLGDGRRAKRCAEIADVLLLVVGDLIKDGLLRWERRTVTLREVVPVVVAPAVPVPLVSAAASPVPVAACR